jgi:HEAT repeat protein
VRRGAAIAIGRVGMTAGADTLTAALSDPSEGVRAAAAFAVGQLGVKNRCRPADHRARRSVRPGPRARD